MLRRKALLNRQGNVINRSFIARVDAMVEVALAKPSVAEISVLLTVAMT